jgi:hypothetical protein
MITRTIFARDVKKGMISPTYGKVKYVDLQLFEVQISFETKVLPPLKNDDEFEILYVFLYEEQLKNK